MAANGATKGKEESKVDEPVERDELGRVIFCLQDFENPLIIHFKTDD